MFFDRQDNIKMQQSPIKEKQIEELIDTKKDVLDHLEHLFTYFASKFSRHNYHKLPHKSYIEMIKKLLNKHEETYINKSKEEKRIESERLKVFEVLYFSKGCKEGATFNQFLEMIPGLAKIVYHELPDQVEASEMITKDLLNLYRR
jgi:hypothetical protein